MKMKKVVWMVIVAVVLGAGATIYFKAAPKTASSQSKSVYSCPMHPDQKSDKPGQCSICHMDMVKEESKKGS